MKSKIALAATVAVLVVSVVANVFLFSAQQGFVLDADIQKGANNELQQQMGNLQVQMANLTSMADYLNNQNIYLQNENQVLEKQMTILANQTVNLQLDNANLKATIADMQPLQPNRAILVTKLGTTDVLKNSNSAETFNPRLFIQGQVFNLGDRTAINARLHVTLFVNDQVIQDTYIELGNIEPLNWVSISRDIHYEANGERLTNWTIIPET